MLPIWLGKGLHHLETRLRSCLRRDTALDPLDIWPLFRHQFFEHRNRRLPYSKFRSPSRRAWPQCSRRSTSMVAAACHVVRCRRRRFSGCPSNQVDGVSHGSAARKKTFFGWRRRSPRGRIGQEPAGSASLRSLDNQFVGCGPARLPSCRRHP